MKIKSRYTPIRFSHITSYAGVGSVIRSAEDKLVSILDIRYWVYKDQNNIAEDIDHVSRIKKALGLQKNFRKPPFAKEIDKGQVVGNAIPAVLFPSYAVCKKCGLLYNNPWKIKNKSYNEEIECDQCDGRLEQVTWCAATEKGHLSDVPWHDICHENNRTDCRRDNNSAYLKIFTNKGKKSIRCVRCKAENQFENTKTKIIYHQQPWIFERPTNLEKKDLVEIMEVNNPLIYLPVRVNALCIPPESRIDKTSIVYKLYNNSTICRETKSIKNPGRKDLRIRQLAIEYKCNKEKIYDALDEIENGYPYEDENIIVTELLHDEYKAFLTPLENVKDNEDFVIIHKNKEWEEMKIHHTDKSLSAILVLVDNLVIAKRLREIQIFKGFYRIRQSSEENLIPPDIVGESDWLPAIELFGEGVFFTINQELLSQWESITSVRQRADEVARRYEKSDVNVHKDIVIKPRFLLLHTLSHLLIRELEASAGYPAASLKERIYSSLDNKMAGVLIYVAVPDIVGSLGGIIESAEPLNFLSLLDAAFKHAQWCSLDPVCSEHHGQGPGWLNRAACHACALIPETSCEYNNVFLDRVFIKGSEESGITGFYDFVKNNLKGI